MVSRRVRRSSIADVPAMQWIEVAAGDPFRQVGMIPIADDPPPPSEELATRIESGHAWTATLEDAIVGYLIADVVDGALHIEQVSIHPGHARQGLGRLLIECAAEASQSAGLSGLSLTTFRDVPWNAPYYSRLGFQVVPHDRLTTTGRAIREAEKRRGLDRWPRVWMSRSGLGPSSR